MKVQTEELPDSEVALSFEVDDDRVERAMDAAYRRIAGRVNIAGFRRGKAPRQLVERVVGHESLMEEALNHLLPEVFEEALRETSLVALTEPEFDVESLAPLRAKARVVVPPPVDLGEYRAIHRAAPDVAVAEEEVDRVVQQLRESHAEWVPVEQPVEVGNRVTIDVVGTVAEERIINQEEIEYLVDPGRKAPFPGFAEHLVSASAGDSLAFDLTAPNEEEEGSLAGKSIGFQVSVKDVKVKELPELDDYFATTVGQYADLADLKGKIEAELRERAQMNADLKIEAEVLDEALEAATLSIPDRLVDHQAHRSRDRLVHDLDSRGLSLEQYLRVLRKSESDFDAERRSDAERTLRRSFILQAIAASEEIVISDDEIDAAIRLALESEDADRRTIDRAIKQPEVRQRMQKSLMEQGALKWLVSNAVGVRGAVPETEVLNAPSN
ncbi:MAG: tig [Chloroflexi bacterium]|nr:tig [Chloroflexota bacterium]